MIKRIVSTKGAKLAIYDYGFKASESAVTVVADTRQPILFSHPTGFHGRVFDQVIKQFDNNSYHCVSLDHRGHGDSTHSSTAGADVSWEEFGEDLSHLVTDAREETFGRSSVCAGTATGTSITTPILGVGHSMGATALIYAALKNPEQFKGLILYEPIMFPSLYRYFMNRMESVAISKAAARRRPHFPSVEHALANYSSKPPLNALHPSVLKDYVVHGFEIDPAFTTVEVRTEQRAEAGVGVRIAAASPPSPASTDATTTASTSTAGRVLLKCRPEYEAGVFNGARKVDIFESSLSQLKVPVWIVAGKSEFMQPSMLATLIHWFIPNSKLIRWNDTGHFGPLVFPERFAKLIKEF